MCFFDLINLHFVLLHAENNAIGFPFGVGTYVEVWGVAQRSSCLRGMTVVACRDAGFPKRYQRGSLLAKSLYEY